MRPPWTQAEFSVIIVPAAIVASCKFEFLLIIGVDGNIGNFIIHITGNGADRIAVAVNDAVVRRGDWAAYRLNDDDRVLLIAPIQGG